MMIATESYIELTTSNFFCQGPMGPQGDKGPRGKPGRDVSDFIVYQISWATNVRKSVWPDAHICID